MSDTQPFSFYCKICQKTIKPKKNSIYFSKTEKDFPDKRVGVLVKMHYRHTHTDYDEQVKAGYEYYLLQGKPSVIAVRLAKRDARAKVEMDLKNLEGFEEP